MGYICPHCGKDFGKNREWFQDHTKAHVYDTQQTCLPMTIRKEQNVANLKSIQNAVKSDRIRVWINFDGDICFENTKTKKVIHCKAYYDMNGEIIQKE